MCTGGDGLTGIMRHMFFERRRINKVDSFLALESAEEIVCTVRVGVCVFLINSSGV